MSDTTEKLGAHEVAAWLRRHPKFLQQFPDLAISMVVPREDGPAASLASYQLEVLRDKNRELSRRLHELFANAQENERLAVRTHQLTLGLMRQHNAADTLRALAEGEPICGRLHPDKNALLYGMRAEDVQSSALLPLPGVGLLAVGSIDPNRFFPGMGTLFLRMMGEAMATALKRFDDAAG